MLLNHRCSSRRGKIVVAFLSPVILSISTWSIQRCSQSRWDVEHLQHVLKAWLPLMQTLKSSRFRSLQMSKLLLLVSKAKAFFTTTIQRKASITAICLSTALKKILEILHLEQQLTPIQREQFSVFLHITTASNFTFTMAIRSAPNVCCLGW